MGLKEDSGGSITQRTIHHVGVASDPANVSHTCINVSRSIVKHILQYKHTSCSKRVPYQVQFVTNKACCVSAPAE